MNWLDLIKKILLNKNYIKITANFNISFLFNQLLHGSKGKLIVLLSADLF